MATENLSNGQGVILATDTTKPANAALKAQGWTVDAGNAEQPAGGLPV